MLNLGNFKKQIFFIFVIYYCNCIEFFTKLSKGEQFCIWEKGEQDRALKINVTSLHDKKIALEITFYHNNNPNLMFSRHSESTYIFSFVTQPFGDYKICFVDTNAQGVINFSLKRGVQAHDTSEAVKHSHKKPINDNIQKLEKMIFSIGKSTQSLSLVTDNRSNDISGLSNSLIILSIATISILSMLALFQSIYLKDFLKKKKII